MGAKSSAYLYETLSDPLSAFSNEPNQAAFNKGFNTNKTLWEFYEDPAQSARLYRFNIGMQGLQRMQPIEQLRDCTSSFILIDSGFNFFCEAFDWDSPSGRCTGCGRRRRDRFCTSLVDETGPQT